MASARSSWRRHPTATALIDELISDFLRVNGFARRFACRMLDGAALRFNDNVDHVVTPFERELASRLVRNGFSRSVIDRDRVAYRHELAMLPPVILDAAARATSVALRVDSITDFLAAQRLDRPDLVEGTPLAPLRRARIADERHHQLWVVERHGGTGFDPGQEKPTRTLRAVAHLEALRERQRTSSDADAIHELRRLLTAAINDLGRDRTCALFFQTEREVWHGRNHAARIQQHRQEKLGLGWAHHDHHTYRSSRSSVGNLMSLLNLLGFQPREHFDAAVDSWGARLLEQPACDLTVLVEIDAAGDEKPVDFTRHDLPDLDRPSSVGLWVALHGESLFEAGLHQLSCLFDAGRLTRHLATKGVAFMPPCTEIPELKLAVTEIESWPVDPARVSRLVRNGGLSRTEANTFLNEGAIGSHLGNVDRSDGYRGFHGRGLAHLAMLTDPRRQARRPIAPPASERWGSASA